MTSDAPEADQVARTCELVGRFAYLFAQLEEQLNFAITKLFKLEAPTAEIITANIDFARKLNIVQSALNEQSAAPEPAALRETIKTLFGNLFAVNDERQVVAHSTFEPHPQGGVKFKRTIARGRLNRVDPHWTEAKFQKEFDRMKALGRS